jgi:hypothetical protein
MLGDQYRDLFVDISDDWAEAIRIMLTKARQMRQSGENGKIVILIKDGVPITVQREDATLIVRGGKQNAA